MKVLFSIPHSGIPAASIPHDWSIIDQSRGILGAGIPERGVENNTFGLHYWSWYTGLRY